MKTKKLVCQIIVLLICGKIAAQDTIQGIINAYYKVTAINVSAHNVTVDNAHGLQRCDKVLIIQMKGADINITNTSSYGTITNYHEAGNYEFAIVSSISGNVVTLMAPLARTYNAGGLVQLVQVPVYNNAVVSAPLTCFSWNGVKGGVLAFEARCTITMNDNIDVSGRGFSGAALLNGSYAGNGHTDYVVASPSPYHAAKGEGIFINGSSTSLARGANANGGGGGNDINAGGGGGANCGAGGHGGDVQSAASATPFITINAGGAGGRALAYNSVANKIFLGGGGGAGQENDSDGTPGGNGGGIIVIEATDIVGNGNSIISNGISVPIAGIDGQGGGGAGGAIVLNIRSGGSISSCDIDAIGGDGGTDNYVGPSCHGKGGGGGGGAIWSSISLSGLTTDVSGGLGGVFTDPSSNCYLVPSFYGGDGDDGCIITELVLNDPRPCTSEICNKGKTTGINSQAEGGWKVNVFPNPSTGRVTIQAPGTGNMNVRVIDISGKVIVDKVVTPVNGSFSLDLPTDQSTYFLELRNGDNQVIHKKLMIAK